VSDRLVAASDVVDDREGDDRSDPVLEKQDLQAVAPKAELADPRFLLDEVEGAGAPLDSGF
jgi:hypothetical protein